MFIKKKLILGKYLYTYIFELCNISFCFLLRVNIYEYLPIYILYIIEFYTVTNSRYIKYAQFIFIALVFICVLL